MTAHLFAQIWIGGLFGLTGLAVLRCAWFFFLKDRYARRTAGWILLVAIFIFMTLWSGVELTRP